MINILIGVCLLIIGVLWLNYETKRINKAKKRGDKFLWSGKPNTFLGIFIVLAIGITMIIRAI